ncbi:hypothetical protein [Spirochaeta isovalerica]|uniref:Uncharacterized protein n=1 Tax=Spirochaeta isovalerica TaxID=150 RepID=A0A841RBS4_9SPIO|nr:hypothetical protein [Spirochaeta isovalerica]MBB6480811.1 hypothetical protein [Spirochaeta isovalerica]
MTLQTTLTYPDGILMGVSLINESLQSSISFQNDNEETSLSQFYFISDRIRIGTVDFSGFSKGLKSGHASFYERNEVEGAVIDRQGKPSSQIGVIFSPRSRKGGFAFSHEELYNSAFLWIVPGEFESASLVLSQSLSLKYENKEEESWYSDEIPFHSSMVSHSLVGLDLGDDSAHAGCRLIVNTSSGDRTGVSLLLSFGGERGLFSGGGEILWFSPFFVSSDFVHSDEAFILRGKGKMEYHRLRLETIFHFRIGRDFLPWQWREIDFNQEIRLEKKWNGHRFYSVLEWSIFRNHEGDREPAYSLEALWEEQFAALSLSGSLLAAYEEGIYQYRIKAGGEISSGDIRASVNLGVGIDEEVTLQGGVKLSCSRDNWVLTGKASFEDLGLYNRQVSDWKPAFSIEFKIKADFSRSFTDNS